MCTLYNKFFEYGMRKDQKSLELHMRTLDIYEVQLLHFSTVHW